MPWRQIITRYRDPSASFLGDVDGYILSALLICVMWDKKLAMPDF